MNALAYDQIVTDRRGRRIPHPCVEMDENIGLATDRFPHPDDLMTHPELIALAKSEARKYLPKYAFDQLFNSKGLEVKTRFPKLRPGARDDLEEGTSSELARLIAKMSPDEIDTLVSYLKQELEGPTDIDSEDQDNPDDHDEDDAASRSAALDRKRRLPAMDSAGRKSFEQLFPETKGIRVVGSGVDRQYRECSAA